MDVAAVLSSLYPAITILLAVMILKERATKIQIFGMALALVAVAFISV
jgi:drug/metabolite transporter (DMT)-like permease